MSINHHRVSTPPRQITSAERYARLAARLTRVLFKSPGKVRDAFLRDRSTRGESSPFRPADVDGRQRYIYNGVCLPFELSGDRYRSV